MGLWEREGFGRQGWQPSWWGGAVAIGWLRAPTPRGSDLAAVQSASEGTQYREPLSGICRMHIGDLKE